MINNLFFSQDSPMRQPLGVTDTVATIALGTIETDYPVTTTIDVSSKVVYNGLMATIGALVSEFVVLPTLHQLRDADFSLVGTSPEATSNKFCDDSAKLLGMSQDRFPVLIHVTNRLRLHVGSAS